MELATPRRLVGRRARSRTWRRVCSVRRHGPDLPLAEPFHRLGIVLWDAIAVGVHCTEITLRGGIALICRLAEPFHRLGEVLLHAPPVEIHECEFVLRLGVPVISQWLPDLQGRSVVMPIVCGLGRPQVDRRLPRWPSPKTRLQELIGTQAASWPPSDRPSGANSPLGTGLSVPIGPICKARVPPGRFFWRDHSGWKLPRRPAIVAIASTGIVARSRAKCDVS